MSRVKVLVVDDSPTMRAVVKAVLRADPDIEVVGEAGDPYEARDAIKLLNPDVLTLDIEMPRMSGLQFLAKIMELRPMPVIMVSSLTQKGAADSIEALSIGAFDCIGKATDGDFMNALKDLPMKIKQAAKSRPRGFSKDAINSTASGSFTPNRNIIAIGSSTGGVEALLTLLSGFPPNCPPTVVTQHMPAAFLQSFAARLDKAIAPSVSTAVEGDALKTGHIYFAPGGDYHLQVTGHRGLACHLLASDPVTGHRPSVDVLFESVANVMGKRAVAIMLTGMGKDGAKGMLQIRQAGGRTIGQDEATSVVYGMARAARTLGAVETELALPLIAKAVMTLCNAGEVSEAT